MHFFIGVTIAITIYFLNFIGPIGLFITIVLSLPFRVGNNIFSFWGGVNHSGTLITVIGLYARARAHIFVVFGCSFFQEAGFGILQLGGISFYSKAGENIIKFLSITIYCKTRHSIINILSLNFCSVFCNRLIGIVIPNFNWYVKCRFK